MAEEQKLNDDNMASLQQAKDDLEQKLIQDREESVQKLIQEKDLDCKESKKALLKMLNARYSQSTKDLTAEMTSKWKQTQMKEQFHLKKQITDL